MDNKKIGIVTVLYNSESVLDDFFNSLNAQTYKNFTLYVIDNASEDKGLEKAKDLASKVSFECHFFPENQNWGIAKGNNIGIKAAKSDHCKYILLANNDIVLNRDAIKILLERLNKTNSTLAVPKIYYYKTDLIWQAGGKFDLLRAQTPHFGYKSKDCDQYNQEKFVDYSSTCFILIKSEVFDRNGIMDETYFVYYDDSDFVYRCIKKNNERLLYVPTSIIEHKVSVSTKEGSDFFIRMIFRNRILFIRKNYKWFPKLITIINIWAYHLLIHPFTMSQRGFSISTRALVEGLMMSK